MDGKWIRILDPWIENRSGSMDGNRSGSSIHGWKMDPDPKSMDGKWMCIHGWKMDVYPWMENGSGS